MSSHKRLGRSGGTTFHRTGDVSRTLLGVNPAAQRCAPGGLPGPNPTANPVGARESVFLFNRRNRNRKGTLRRRAAALAAAGVVATGGALAAASPASAATVSDTAIAAAAKRSGLAGCRGIPAGTWVAIALAESGGNPYAHARVGEDSRGLWQINLRAHGGWVGKRNLFDPDVNAWAAKRVCEMQGPTAWSVYTKGHYKKFLGRGYAAAARV